MPATDFLLPSYNLSVTPPGNSSMNLAKYLTYNGATTSCTITQNFGRQGDTAQLVLTDDYSSNASDPGSPSFVIPPFSLISLLDNNLNVQQQNGAEGLIFTGLVTDPQWRWTSAGGGGRAEWILNCVDYSYYADTAVGQGLYAGVTADNIMVDITHKCTPAIKAELAADGGHVYPGPNIPLARLSYDQLSSHWTNISTLATQSGIFGWYVDPQRNLWFYDQSRAIPSNVIVTDIIGQQVNYEYAVCGIDINNPMTYEWDGTTFYTRCVVEGALVTKTFDRSKAVKGTIPPTDSWISSGNQSSWPLSYQPDITSASLKTAAGLSTTTKAGLALVVIGGSAANALQVALGNATSSGNVYEVDYYDGSTPVTTPFQIAQDATTGVWYLQVTPGIGFIPGPGVQINLFYKYQAPVTAQADLSRQQELIGGPNDGVFSEYISDTSLTSVPAALNRATAQLQEYGFPQERLTFYTPASWVGWFRCGQSFTLHTRYIPDSQNNFNPGFVGQFFITQMQVQFTNGGYRQVQVTAVRIE